MAYAGVEATSDRLNQPIPICVQMGAQQQQSNPKNTLIFTYGTLKRGFPNHLLMQDLIRTGDAAFFGTYRTSLNYPLVCGPYRVPFLLNLPGYGRQIVGELYAVTILGLSRLDELEGTSRGHYERFPIAVQQVVDGETCELEESEGLTSAEAYYAHRSYAMELWRKSGEKGFGKYSEKEAEGYVKRKDRPHNLTFLDHIRLFLSSSD